VPEDLHTLLTNANERGPYVIVGQELGAAFARVFASRYRSETAAVIAIDMPTARTPDRQLTRLVRMSPWLARMGVARALDLLGRHAEGLPGDDERRLRAFLNRPDHLTRAASELSQWRLALDLASEASLDPALPIEPITVSGDKPLAYLTGAADAQRVAAAIVAAATHVRSTSTHHR
jgi:pimeloyl-ACP methyl ester carboxylesterase